MPSQGSTPLDKTKRNLNRYALPYLGQIKLQKFNAQILDEWKNTISELKLQKKILFVNGIVKKISKLTIDILFGGDS